MFEKFKRTESSLKKAKGPYRQIVLDRDSYSKQALRELGAPPPLPLTVKTSNISKEIVKETRYYLNRLVVIPVTVVLSFGVISIVVAMLTFKFWWDFDFPQKMATKDYERLHQVSKEMSDGQAFDWAMAMDNSVIWVVTNSFLKGMVSIRLESVPGQILDQVPVVVSASAQLDRHLASFKEFNFQTGNSLTSGRYNLTMRPAQILERPFFSRFMPFFASDFVYEEKIIIGFENEEEFQQKLAQYKEQFAARQTDEVSELTMKFQTLQAIVMQISQGLSDVFKSDFKGKDKSIAKFEELYNMQYGHFFTTFIIDNGQTYDKLAQRNFKGKVELLANIGHLIRTSQLVGESTMQALLDMKKTMGQEEWKALSLTVLDQLHSVHTKCQSIIDQMQLI